MTKVFDHYIISVVDENAEVHTLMQTLQLDDDEKRPSKFNHDRSKEFSKAFKTSVAEDAPSKQSAYNKSKTFQTPRLNFE